MKKHAAVAGSLSILIMLSGCQATGESNRANVYSAGQVNTQQEVKTVNILAILPAKIEVDNSKNKQTAQVAGAVLGAIAGGLLGNSMGDRSGTNTALGVAGGGALGAGAGSMVPDKSLVDGVQIAYEKEGKPSAPLRSVCFVNLRLVERS